MHDGLQHLGGILAYFPVRVENINWWYAGGYLACVGIVLVLGMRSLAGLGPVRKWVAIGTRVLVLTLLFLILCGVQWSRRHKDLELLVVRDISNSVRNFKGFEGQSLDEAFKRYLKQMTDRNHKPVDDRIGEIVFSEAPQIDAMPNKELVTDAAAIHDPELANQTDVASALELALSTFRPDAMRRLLLVWDGNQTIGNVDAVAARAKSMGIPIDVMPLKYAVKNEVLMERFVGPSWRRENEPFTIEVFVRSTNITEVKGKLEVSLDEKPLELAPGSTSRMVTLKPGLNRFPVTVPGLPAGIKRFKATIDGQAIEGGISGAKGDTLLENNVSEGFTAVRGKGKVLYVDNMTDDAGQKGPGDLLATALESEGIVLEKRDVGLFPKNQVELQNYDAVVLANVPYGLGGLNTEQDKMLARYVHDMGGGLVMIGGKDSFGAGAWQGTKTEEILPLNMDIPAQRQMPKGALVLIMHSCEMPKGNYWGEQCALQAVKTLSDRDEVGVISYGWGGAGGGGIGGAQWDFPLNEKGDGSKVEAAIKRMQLGDMPSFDDALNLAVNGTGPKAPSLKNSDARQKHIIIISDGDPQPPQAGLYQQLIANKITVSTVTVYPHQLGAFGVPPTMEEIATKTKGRYYPPIDSNPNQLPQIFIKEATVVRRSLIFEKSNPPIGLKLTGSSSDLIKGLSAIPPVRGMVLTSKKNNPQVDVSLVAGENNDPVLASWQAGLGRAVAFTSDATDRWGNYWVASGSYAKFWAQVVRSVARPPMSTDFDIRVSQEGNKAKITVEALNKESGFLNFLNIAGGLVKPNMKQDGMRLVQTGPGVYQTEVDARDAGNYVFMLTYTGAGNKRGYLLGGFAQNSSPETRELQSNDGLLEQIAEKTGGRVIDAFADVNLFSRENLPVAASPLPVWDILLPFLLALIIIDVAIRRIAWDWMSTKRAAAAAANWVRSFTTVRKVEKAEETLGALKSVREQVAEQKFKPAASGTEVPLPPDPKAKFEAKQGVAGDITSVVGGATDKPVPPPPKKVQPKGQQGESGGGMSSLMAAKKRAQEKIREKEQEGQ